MASSYTPIPASNPAPPSIVRSPLSANLDYMSRANHQIHYALATCRPWSQVFSRHALSRPRSLLEAIARLRGNLSYFRINFAILVLFALFLSLVWRPISLLVLVGMMGAWLFFFFLRDEPVVFLGYTLDDRLVLALLALLTVSALLLTSDATANVLISVAAGLAVVVVYSIFRRTDDHFLDEEAAVSRALVVPAAKVES